MRSDSPIHYSIVVPFYNEQENVPQLYVKIIDTMDAIGEPYEMIFVDDGSRDGTFRQLSEIAQADERVVVVRLRRNFGQTAALKAGFDHSNGEIILSMDGDLQHDPAEIPKLLAAAARGGGDFVIAEREFARQAMPPARYYSNVIGSRILSWFIGSAVADTQCGFRLIRRDLLRRVTLTGRGYEIETEMLIKLARTGAQIERVKVARLEYQGVRSHIRPFRDTFRTCMLAVRYRYLTGRS